MRTEFFRLFIESKTGWFGRDFKKHAAGFAKINRMKIRAIDYWRHVVAKVDQMFAPLELFVFVLHAKCDVMHRTCRDPPQPGVRQTKQINNSARRRLVRRGKPKSVS